MKNPTLNDAKRIIKKNNPGLSNLKVSWVKKPEETVDFNGRPFGIAGLIAVAADGFRSRNMSIERFDGGISVR